MQHSRHSFPIVAALLFAVGLGCSGTSLHAQAEALAHVERAGSCAGYQSKAHPELEVFLGRWEIGADRVPGIGWFSPILEIAPTDGEDVVVTMLGGSPSRTTTRIKKGKLDVKLPTPLGNMIIQASLEKGEMSGIWKPANIIGRLFLGGRVVGIRKCLPERDALQRVEIFDRACDQVERLYFDPTFGGRPWKELKAAHRAEALAARNDGDLVRALHGLFHHLKSSHLVILDTNTSKDRLKEMLPPGTRPAPNRAVEWREVEPSIAYLRIRYFSNEASGKVLLDQAFASFSTDKALILDLRGNPGGTYPMAEHLAGHLLDKPVEVGYFVSRKILERFGWKSPAEVDPSKLPTISSTERKDYDQFMEREGGGRVFVGGHLPNPFAGRVVLLVDDQTYSTAEAVAIAMMESGRATLIGQKTSGAMLGSHEVDLGAGWKLQVPFMDFYSARRFHVEGAGVQPDIQVKPGFWGDRTLKQAIRICKDNR